MKVLLTGGKGMLGRTLVRELGGDFEVVPTDLQEADITDENAIDAVFARHAPDVVIHCAAMTAVDRCETERDMVFRLNARGTANVAAACARASPFRLSGEPSSRHDVFPFARRRRYWP